MHDNILHECSAARVGINRRVVYLPERRSAVVRHKPRLNINPFAELSCKRGNVFSFLRRELLRLLVPHKPRLLSARVRPAVAAALARFPGIYLFSVPRAAVKPLLICFRCRRLHSLRCESANALKAFSVFSGSVKPVFYPGAVCRFCGLPVKHSQRRL